MFVRFRERPNDARDPGLATATRLCSGHCNDRKRMRRAWGQWGGEGCPEQPRCRWRVNGLVPYRLLVSLGEAHRVEGKVRQDHVADLGAIDGTMLPAFYAKLDAEAAQTVHAAPAWRHASIVTRLGFWTELNARLARLANRIDDGQAALVRQAVHERIPLPTTEEIAEAEAWEWLRLREGYQGLVDRNQTEIEWLEDQMRHKRKGIALLQPIIADIIAEAHSPERHQLYNRTLGQILARDLRMPDRLTLTRRP
jgi:predicted transcriptional regulator